MATNKKDARLTLDQFIRETAGLIDRYIQAFAPDAKINHTVRKSWVRRSNALRAFARAEGVRMRLVKSELLRSDKSGQA